LIPLYIIKAYTSVKVKLHSLVASIVDELWMDKFNFRPVTEKKLLQM